jgi:hypothetical protein
MMMVMTELSEREKIHTTEPKGRFGAAGRAVARILRVPLFRDGVEPT